MPQFFEEHLGKEAVAPALSSLQSQSNEDALRIRPFTGLDGLVRQLSANGDKIGVWTNRDLTSAQLILKHSGLEPYVTVCVSGSCVSQRKPHPEGLSRVMDHLGIRPEAVTMIGDHEHDVMAAKAAGVRAVRASWHGYWQVENCVHSDHQFHSVQEFSTWVERESRC
jgi:phosphoglycolate phosphatase